MLESIKRLIPNYKSKYPSKFQNILETFSEEHKLSEEKIDSLWKAY